MGRRKYLLVFLVLAVYCNGISHAEKRNPLKDPRICGRPQCHETNNKFRYQQYRLYKYDYSMYVKTHFSGSGENSSELHLIAAVEIDFPKPCQGLLKLHSIEVRDRPLPVVEEQDFEYGADYVEPPPEVELHPKSDVISEELMRFELKFAFHDGVVGEICHEEEEPVWTLNLKRGILSSFQNSMPRFDIDYHTTETDVSGVCDVSYTMSGSKGTSLTIRKTKDIASCKRRYKTNSLIQTVPYEFRPNYVAWPILNSTSYCNISVDNFVYKEAICYERHQLVPFSNGQAGAVTESFSKLTLADEESYTPEEQNVDDEYEIQKRSSLIYDHTPSARDSHDEIKASRELLKELCRQGFPDIQRNFPDVFLNFLSTTRVLSLTALSQLLYRSKSICDNGK
ncbi:vitellogenin-like [Aedes albopictus]|uniref:Vitellogenin domain-containing protein n=1 Tax=Aedes albopictus TaxID=7160 RepID=A0ABM1YZY1_AEDAL